MSFLMSFYSNNKNFCMEANSVHFSAAADRSISTSDPYKQIITNPSKRRNAHGFISRSTDNLLLSNSSSSSIHTIHGGGLLFGPPSPLSFTYPPSLSALQQNQRQQPPLLPLPISKPYSSLPASISRGISCPSASRKNNPTRGHSIMPMKAKQPARREKPKLDPKLIDNMVEPSAQLGPDLSDPPKDVPSSLPSSIAGNRTSTLGTKHMEKFSSLVYIPSPHPSCLPLPKFSLRRPKLISCTGEASIDDGATDNVRRHLRLR